MRKSKNTSNLIVIGSSTPLANSLNKAIAGGTFLGRTNPFDIENWIQIPDLAQEKGVENTSQILDNLLNISPKKGSYHLVQLQGISSKNWTDSINVNLLSVARLSETFIDFMLGNNLKGSLTYMGSASSWLGGKAPYSATKAGLTGLMHAINSEYGPNVRANIVLPGAFEGGMTEDWDAKKRKKVSDKTYIKRLATADEIANSIFFAINNLYLCGATINMTNGQVRI